jgi:hypothetical protein
MNDRSASRPRLESSSIVESSGNDSIASVGGISISGSSVYQDNRRIDEETEATTLPPIVFPRGKLRKHSNFSRPPLPPQTISYEPLEVSSMLPNLSIENSDKRLNFIRRGSEKSSKISFQSNTINGQEGRNTISAPAAIQSSSITMNDELMIGNTTTKLLQPIRRGKVFKGLASK